VALALPLLLGRTTRWVEATRLLRPRSRPTSQMTGVPGARHRLAGVACPRAASTRTLISVEEVLPVDSWTTTETLVLVLAEGVRLPADSWTMTGIQAEVRLPVDSWTTTGILAEAVRLPVDSWTTTGIQAEAVLPADSWTTTGILVEVALILAADSWTMTEIKVARRRCLRPLFPSLDKHRGADRKRRLLTSVGRGSPSGMPWHQKRRHLRRRLRPRGAAATEARPALPTAAQAIAARRRRRL
jgi:hypothetical protein